MDDVSNGKPGGVQYFNEWVERVKKVVPEDRLLVFSVKEGWEPLCKFLGKPVPNQPFPRINDTQSIQRATRFFKYVGITACVIGGLALYGLVSLIL